MFWKWPNRRPDEEFAFFPIVDASRVPAAEIAIAGYPNLTDAMKRKPTTLDAPCARASQSCGVNLKLVEGFSGSPVIWNDGITVVGMLTKSTTRATDDSTFVHLAFLSHWLEKLVGVKPPGPLPTLTRTALPSLDDLGGQVVCDVADSGYIPLLSHKLIALPNYLEVAGRSSRQTFSLVGDVVDGFDHLHVTSKVNADCSTDIYAINPTTEAGPSSVPTRLEATQNVYSTSMIVPPGDFLVPVAQSEKINIGVGRVITLKVENPSAISLDFTDPTFLTRLIDTKVERESLFLVDEILVSDILSEQNTGRGAEIDWKAASKVDFHKRFKGIGSVMGVKMKRIDVTRWPYAFKAGDTYSEPGAFAFSEAYKKLLKVDFRPEKKFFDIDPAENGFEVVFHSPLTNPTRRILISSRVPPQDSNIITIKLAYPVNTHDRYM